MLFKLIRSLKNDGFMKTLSKVIRYFQYKLNHSRFQQVLAKGSIEDRFTWIYKTNYWQSEESVSGVGSTLKYTENLRKELPLLISKYGIRTIFDAPCGDFNWMSHLLTVIDVNYIGGDIVRPLIDGHNQKHKTSTIKFISIDLTKGDFPEVDMMICRDCLFHLSFEDTKLILTNFLKSRTPYLLTTTHKQTSIPFKNRNIETGDFRLIDLFSSPYNFPKECLESIDDWLSPEPERKMCLWSREQVAVALTSLNQL